MISMLYCDHSLNLSPLFCLCYYFLKVGKHNLKTKALIKVLNPLSAKLTKWPNTLKQFVVNLPKNCLSVFVHFVLFSSSSRLITVFTFTKFEAIISYHYSIKLFISSRMSYLHMSFTKILCISQGNLYVLERKFKSEVDTTETL